MPHQRRAIPHEPQVTERICEAALTMPPPRRQMVANGIVFHCCARSNSPCDERLRIVAEHLDTGGGHAEMLRYIPAIVLGLADK